ncbi:MAG TPA: hypothetical protein VGR62_05700 [Candidatus Binatia bacterium]|jgi:hypothetical protein|nr:hypothetical protein [Candidatus Binatia bacterium]
MRAATVVRFLSLIAVLGGVVPGLVRAAEGPEYPMSGGIQLAEGATPAKRRVNFQGKWSQPATGMANPVVAGATLRVYGAPQEGDSGIIRLANAYWRPLKNGKGFQYSDATQSAGGIRSVVVKSTKKGGLVKIAGGKESWAYRLATQPTAINVALTIGDARFCAAFTQPKNKKGKSVGRAKRAPAACPCDQFDSTWAAIQTVIFERRGCTSLLCHDSTSKQNGLDLQSPGVYERLVKVYSEQGLMSLVEPGSATNDSFLWRKVASGTGALKAEDVPGTPMPQGLTPLTADELEALRLWIQGGAPKEGVIEGTEARLNSCLPASKPPRIDPPAAPAAGEGLQFFAPPWNIPAGDEDEVCYATYYDVTAQVPAEFTTPCPDYWGGPSKTCFIYNRSELTQEPNSHHSIIHLYRGEFDPTYSAPGLSPGFQFQCHGGAQAGQACDPRTAGVCGGDGVCRGKVVSSLACLKDFGPPDYNRGADPTGNGSDNAPAIGGSQQPFARTVYPSGVFATLPLTGTMIWNSHAFNLTSESTENQQWWNLYFAPPDQKKYPLRAIFDSRDIFVQDVPPFEEREYCRTITFPLGTRIFEISSHNHKRGRLFRVWGPGITQACRSTQDNPGACTAEPPPAQPILVTTQYNDPAVSRVAFEFDDPNPTTRRLKFCAIYSNGLDPEHPVKQNSISPIPPSFGTLAPGGPCFSPPGSFFPRDLGIACISGDKKGQLCAGDHSFCGPADQKLCDACPLAGGVTTEDEMFILTGNFYCAPDSDCSGRCAGGPKAGQFCNYDNAFCREGVPEDDDTVSCQQAQYANN